MDISEVVPMPVAIESNQTVRVKLDYIAKNQEFKPLLDVRGFRVNDAVDAFDVFLIKHYWLMVKEVKVLHGKGSGQLKLAIQSAGKII